MRQTHVYADYGACRWKGLSRNVLAHDSDVPANSFPFYRDRLYAPPNSTMLVHAHVSDALNPEASLRIVRGGIPPTAVAIPREDDGVKVANTLEARVSRSLTGFDPTEERLESLVQAAQGGLL
jgi:hypothetical protein